MEGDEPGLSSSSTPERSDSLVDALKRHIGATYADEMRPASSLAVREAVLSFATSLLPKGAVHSDRTGNSSGAERSEAELEVEPDPSAIEDSKFEEGGTAYGRSGKQGGSVRHFDAAATRRGGRLGFPLAGRRSAKRLVTSRGRRSSAGRTIFERDHPSESRLGEPSVLTEETREEDCGGQGVRERTGCWSSVQA